MIVDEKGSTNLNICTKFHFNPSNICRKHLTLSHKCQPAGSTTGKVKGPQESLGFIFQETCNVCTKCYGDPSNNC